VAKLTSEKLVEIMQPYLEPGEQVISCAYGMQQPSWGLIIPLMIVAIVPGAITQALLTKYYMAALTNRRILFFNCTSGRKIKEIIEYRPGALPPANISKGAIFAVLKVEDPRGPLRVKFHRSAIANNREQAVVIGNAFGAKLAA
jgi:hypothetical protein